MKKLLIVVLVLLTACISAIVWMNLQWNKPSAPAILQVESALNEQTTLAFGFIDFEQVNPLLADDNAISGLLNEQPSWVQSLYNEQLSSQLKQAIFALSVSESKDEDTSKPEYTNYSILHGQFNVEAILNLMEQGFEITELSSNLYQMTKKLDLTQIIPTACFEKEKARIEQNSTQELFIATSEKWIVQADRADAASDMLSKLNNASQESGNRLALPWQSFKLGKIAAFAVFNPEQSADSVSGMRSILVSSLQSEYSEVNALYTGASIDYLNQALQLDVQLNASDSWAKANESLLKQTLLTQIERSVLYSKELAAWFERVQVSSVKEALKIQLDVKQENIDRVPDIALEIISTMFLPNLFSDDEDTEEESIDDDSWDFSQNQLLKTELPFLKSEYSSLPKWVKGSFALNLGSISFNEEQKTIELYLSAYMQMAKLENSWFDSEAELQLSDIKILDAQGNDLIRDERCIEGIWFGNQSITKGRGSDEHISLGKHVRLNPTAKLADIERIQGQLDFTAPVDVMELPIEFKVGAVASAYGIDVKIAKTGKQTFKYLIEGDEANVIDIRAFNAKGQPLDSRGSMSFGTFKTANFKGDVVSVKVYIAKEWLKRSQNFDIEYSKLIKTDSDDYYYQLKTLPEAVNIDDLSKATSSDLSVITKEIIGKKGYLSSDTPIVAQQTNLPIALFIGHNHESTWGYQPTLISMSPIIKPLSMNLQALKLELGGKIYYLPINHGFQIEDDHTVGEFRGDIEVQGIDYDLASTDLTLDIKEQQKLDTLTGILSYQLPTAVNVQTIDIPSFQPVELDSGINIRIQAIEYGFMERYLIEVSGDKFINLLAITDQGDLIPDKTEYKDGNWLLTYDLNPEIKGFKLITAEDLVIEQYPVSLTAEY
jgi:hypothetical protein